MGSLPTWIAWMLGVVASLIAIVAGVLQIQAIREAKPGPLDAAVQLGKLTGRLLTGKLSGQYILSSQAVQRDDSPASIRPVADAPVPEPAFVSSSRTLVVSASKYDSAQFNSIEDALTAASPGDRILLLPGKYTPTRFIVDKPIEIVGQGEVGDVLITFWPIVVSATGGRMVNVTVHGSNTTGDTIRFTAGRFIVEDCDISSESGTCVQISDGASPILRRNKIHHGRYGIFVTDHGRGQIEENDIFASSCGVGVARFGNPILRRNTIHRCHDGVSVGSTAQAALYANTITENQQGISINDAQITVKGNSVANNGVGVLISGQCTGIFEENEMRNNQSKNNSVDPRNFGLQSIGNGTDRTSFTDRYYR